MILLHRKSGHPSSAGNWPSAESEETAVGTVGVKSIGGK